MEVSNFEVEPGGQELIQTVVTLTGLPDPWVRNELDRILEDSGQSASDVTLNQLREALVAYLEAMQADFVSDENTQTLE